MRALGPGLWVHDQPFMGIRFGLRMSVVRFADGRLLLHSPTAPNAALRAEVDALGEVAWLVAGNNHHHRWLLPWKQIYPRAAAFVSRDVPRKRAQLRDYTLLDHTPVASWQNELDQTLLEGVPFFDETVFFHRPSGSLLVTDFVQNHIDPGPLNLGAKLAGVVFAGLGFRGICCAPPLKLRVLQRDRAAFARTLAKVQKWPVQRIVVTHGQVVETAAADQLAQVIDSLGVSAG